ncbi:band 7 protein [Fischerella sp. NIES-4106]|jgi:regulator of protease activity HflC (stomatin/prohibitin superfamily)|nr:band 7 protein [Fischerella sp. NIES-4106]
MGFIFSLLTSLIAIFIYLNSGKISFVLEKERQEAERKRIEATGIADSQKIIADGLSNSVLQLRAIEATEKLAQSPNSKIIVIGSEKGTVPILLQQETK